MKTNPPTETVSDCSNCGEDMGNALWASIQDGNPKHLHMCGKCAVSLDNLPTEPTVDKWEGHGGPLKYLLSTLTPKQLEASKIIVDFEVYRAVQEAKAEMAEYCEHTRKCVLSHKYPTCTCGLDNLLTSLRKEGGK